MDEYYYEIVVAGVSKAFCRSWETKQAALRLLFGTALMLPPSVQIIQVKKG